MIAKVDQKEKIVESIIESLSNLNSYGFSQPRVTQEEWSTTLRLMLAEIALEIEIDWRDLDVFVLVVRLENGNLPSGYYVSDGQPCRYHLQKVINDKKWSVDEEALAMISPGNKRKGQSAKYSEDDMLDRFREYKKVLDSCVENLVERGDTIFT